MHPGPDRIAVRPVGQACGRFPARFRLAETAAHLSWRVAGSGRNRNRRSSRLTGRLPDPAAKPEERARRMASRRQAKRAEIATSALDARKQPGNRRIRRKETIGFGDRLGIRPYHGRLCARSGRERGKRGNKGPQCRDAGLTPFMFGSTCCFIRRKHPQEIPEQQAGWNPGRYSLNARGNGYGETL